MRGFGFGRARQARRRLGGVPSPTLSALSLAASGIVENSAAGTVVGGVLGKTTGSTLALVDTAGGRFALSGGSLVAGATGTDYETATSHNVTIRETLAGYANSPRDTVLAVTVSNVFEQANLAALSLSATSFTIGTPTTGSITGATAGSTIAATGLPGGLTVNGAARTFAWSGSGAAATSTVTLTETLADSANSPRASNVSVTVAAAPASLPNYRAALAAARAGSAGPLIVNAVGDSTIAGSGATMATSLPRQLADQFSATLTANGADVSGTTFGQSDYATYNPAVTPGSWSPNGGVKTVGGYAWCSTASGANFAWTAENRAFDRLCVYFIQNSGLGTYRVKVDGSTVGTVNTSGTGGIGLAVFTVTLGTHIVELEWVSGACFFAFLETMDTTAKSSVRVRNLGWGGARSANIAETDSPWASLNAIQALEAAHLHVSEDGQVNDWLSGAGGSTHAANVATISAGLQTKGGDVLLLGATRSSTSSGPAVPAATQQGYVDAMAALANGTTTVFYDLKTGVGDYAAMSAAGRMFDEIHPNGTGYTAEAAAMYAAVLA